MTDTSKLSQYVIGEIRSTPEYLWYEEKLTEIKKDPVLYQRVNEMREKNFQLNQKENSEEILELMDALTNEYEDVINIKLVSEFMEAEAGFCRVMQTFIDSVTMGLEFD